MRRPPLSPRRRGSGGDRRGPCSNAGKSWSTTGYHEQVKVTAGSVLLFAIQDGARVAIQRQNDALQHRQRKTDAGRIAGAHRERDPDKFNANVLLRPVMQDTLLPTLAYIGGPAEVAYFAQGSVVYQRLLGRATPICRASARP